MIDKIMLTLLVSMSSATCSNIEDPRPATHRYRSEVDEKTKIDVIKFLLNKTTKTDDVVEGHRYIYIDVDEKAFSEMPEKVNDLIVRRVMKEGDRERQKVSYLTWRAWRGEGDLILVTNIAFFSDGNSGGCNYKLKRTDSSWQEIQSDCFAAAS
jgi:hypothetical protein